MPQGECHHSLRPLAGQHREVCGEPAAGVLAVAVAVEDLKCAIRNRVRHFGRVVDAEDVAVGGRKAPPV